MFDSNVRLAKVVRVYPGGRSADLVMFDDNSPCTNVQVTSGAASTRSGFSGMIEPTLPPDGEWGNQDSGDQDVTALVAFMKGNPIIIGFLFPQVCQMLFPDKNRMIFRSPSDLYSTIDDEGNFELAHPSGAYVRVGTNPEHEDLTGKDFDGKWKIARNTDKKVYVHIEQAGGLAVLDITPDGAITIQSKSTIDVVAEGKTTVKAPSVKIDTPTAEFTGDVNVSGGLHATRDITSDGKILDKTGNSNHHVH